MDKDLRASLVVAGSAAALSALIGIFAGVGFLTLFLRAIVCALVLGGAVYGGIFLLRRTIPGIFSPVKPQEDYDALRGDEPEIGTNIDIVLPGESATESFVGPDELSAYAALGRKDEPGRIVADDEAAELSPVDETSLLDGDEAAAMPVVSIADKGRRASSSFEDLDVLPDLEGFSDSFTASEFASGGSGAVAAPSKGYVGPSSPGSRAGQEGLDPASLAQAVRTILKRDQKG